MNTLILWRIRSAKVAWLSSMLLLLLNRTPVLRMLVSVEFSAGPRLGEMLRALVPLALASGAVNTLTGATQFTSNPATPAAATSGQPFNMVFAVTGAPSTTKCYSIDGTLPAGLSVPNATVSGTNRTLNASNGSITGTPTESGSFTIEIRGWEKASRGGKSTKAYNITINVTGAAATTPAFTTQPSSVTVTAGGSASFTVAVSGSPAPTLQWRKGGANLTGQTGTTLTLSSVTTGSAGSYDCVATNSAGSATSNAATLTVNAAATTPAFTAQPSSLTVTAGGSASFTVAVSGSPAPTLQWRKGGANLTGQTGTTLTLSNVTTGSAGSYDCVATNSAGSATSNAATLTVNAAASAPAFTAQPSSLTVTAGGSASFTVAVSGSPSPTLQWRKGGANLTGQTGTTLTLSNVTTGSAGSYDCVATNSAGSATSNTATLTVNAATAAPAFTAQPTSQSVAAGGSVTFSVSASGNPTPTLQWRFGGTNLSGQIGTSLTLNNVQAAQAGTYDCVATNSAGSATSSSATLSITVQSPPTITYQPVAMTSRIGTGASFSVQAEGTGLTYQWRKDGVAIAGATRSIYSIGSIQASDAGTYSVIVTNPAGKSVTSTGAVLSASTTGSARLVNMSTRAGIGSATTTLIPGMVIEGDVSLTVLVRAIGPELQTYGVSSFLADPVLTIFSGSHAVATNDDWGQAPNLSAIESVSTDVGAFELPDGSADSALLISLPPGAYTIQVSGKNGATGESLAEVYVVDQD